MSGRALRWGLAAAAALVTFYVVVLVTASDWMRLAAQDCWLLTLIVVGFGTQVAPTVELRRRHRAQHLGATTGAGTGASAVGMVACCAHHLADLVPLVGATGMAAFLFDWRPFMLGGIGVNAVAVTIAGRRLHALTAPHQEVSACAA